MWSKLVAAIGVKLGLSANPATAGFDDPMEFYVAMAGGANSCVNFRDPCVIEVLKCTNPILV